MEFPELSLKIGFYLVIAGIVGWIIGFWLGRVFGSANATELLNESESRKQLQSQEMNELRSELAAANTKINELEAELMRLTTTVKTREDWIAEMEAMQKEIQDDLEARVSELDELKAETDQERASLQAQREEVEAEAKAEIEALQLRLAEAEGRAKLSKQAEAEMASLRANFADKERALAQALFRLKNLESSAEQVKERDARLQEWEEKYAALGREKDSEVARLKVRITELEMMAREIKGPAVKASPASAIPPSPTARDDGKKAEAEPL